MQYTILHACGHRAMSQIYGTNVHGERERKAAWLASKPCTACWCKAQKAKALMTEKERLVARLAEIEKEAK